jgi:hypothetical protein
MKHESSENESARILWLIVDENPYSKASKAYFQANHSISGTGRVETLTTAS